jgi:hypothetical protein
MIRAIREIRGPSFRYLDSTNPFPPPLPPLYAPPQSEHFEALSKTKQKTAALHVAMMPEFHHSEGESSLIKPKKWLRTPRKVEE